MKRYLFLLLAMVLACSQTSTAPPEPAPTSSPAAAPQHAPSRIKPKKPGSDAPWLTAPRAPLKAQPKLMAATGGRPPIIPVSWTEPAWFVDPVSGNDTNNCTQTGTPCKTYAEIAARWGTYNPRLRQNVVFTWLSSASDNTDPVYMLPYLENGANVQITGLLNGSTQVATGTLSGVVAKNRATGQLLTATLGGSAVKGQFIVNSTHPSRAWVYTNVSGTTFNISQPVLALGTPPLASNNLTEVDTWANLDAFTTYAPVAINLVKLQPTVTDYDLATFGNGIYVTNATIFDPTGAGDDLIYAGTPVYIIETISQRVYNLDAEKILPNNGTPAGMFNSYLLAGFYGGTEIVSTTFSGGSTSLFAAFNMFAGVTGDTASSFFGTYINPAFDYDAIMTHPAFNDPQMNGGDISSLFLDTGVYLSVQSNAQVAGDHVGPFVWGAGTLNVSNSTRLIHTGAATGAFLNTGGILLNGLTTAYSVCLADAGLSPTITGGIALTNAHLDAACGAAGFGGTAIQFGGASISSGNP